MNVAMKDKLKLAKKKEKKEARRSNAESVKGLRVWAPPGGVEIYVHSMLSDPYGADDADGLDAALSASNIDIARKCQAVSDAIEDGSESKVEGLRKIGKMIVGAVMVVPSEKFSEHQRSVKDSEVVKFTSKDRFSIR